MLRPSEAKHAAPKDPPLPDRYDWALRGVTGNITATAGEVQAWLVLNPVDWNYRSNEQCEAEIDRQVRFWLALSGREYHMRSLMLPYPVSAWARNLDLNTPDPVDKAQWADHLRTKQRALRGGSLGENVTMVGVTLGGRNYLTSALDRARSSAAAGAISRATGRTILDGVTREAQRLREEIEALTSAVSDSARPATQREVEWLLHQSRGLLLPTPYASITAGDAPLDPYDLAGIYDTVEVDPGHVASRAIRLTATTARTGGREIERWVSVLSVGRMEELRIPEKQPPWLAYALQFPGAETSVRGRVVTGADAAKAVEAKIRLVQDQAPQYAKHQMMSPPNLGRVLATAIALQDEMEESHAKDATRVYTWARIAVAAPTKDEVHERARRLRAHFERLNVAIEQPRNQEGLYREFTPGEPLSTTAHLRRMPVRMFAAGVPQVTGSIGDRQGSHFGHTVGVVSTPFMWDMHRGMEVLDASGLTPVVGGLGSGKSSFIGGAAAYSAERGILSTVLDPSGPLAKIAQWGPIAEHSAVVDLLRSDNGSLAPFAVIPEPTIEAARRDPDILRLPIDEQRDAATELHAQNIVIAAIERKALAVDVMRNSLPQGLFKHAKTEYTLQQAVRTTEGRYTSSLATALSAMKDSGDDHAATLYATLMEISEHPHARLFFSSGYMQHRGDGPAGIDAIDKTLLVLTMGGLVLPKASDSREMWGVSERLAVPLLSLASHYTTARIYRRGMDERKFVAVDEAHFMSEWPSGRALVAKLERDSRKWNARVLMASQDTLTALSSQKASKSLISDAVIFNISGAEPEQQRGGLELLQVPRGHGYERTVSSLRPADDESLPPERKWRDALVRVNGKVGRVRFDFGDFPELKELLISTPNAGRAMTDTVRGAGEWF